MHSVYDIVLCVYERFRVDGLKRYVNDDRFRVDGDKNMRLLAFAFTIVFVWTGPQSIGPGEKTRRKYSSTGGRAPGYRISKDHFQTEWRMLAPDWAQKLVCIIVPNRRTASPEFFSRIRTRQFCVYASVSNNEFFERQNLTITIV